MIIQPLLNACKNNSQYFRELRRIPFLRERSHLGRGDRLAVHFLSDSHQDSDLRLECVVLEKQINGASIIGE